MKTFESYEETVTKRRLTGIFCDKCESEIKDNNDEHYNVNQFVLERVTGNMWPEGGGGNKWFVKDLCDNCILELRGLLTTWGATITDEEWEA